MDGAVDRLRQHAKASATRDLLPELLPSESLARLELWLSGSITEDHGDLLAELVLFTNPALWPDAQLGSVLCRSLGCPVGFAAWVIGQNRFRLERLMVRTDRRIRAVRLAKSIGTGSQWPEQLGRIRRLVWRMMARAVSGDPVTRAASLQLGRVARALARFLVNHPICGTPEAHALQTQADLTLQCLQAESPRPDSASSARATRSFARETPPLDLRLRA
ncbi:MAG: hypothetical protein ABI647_15080 [Gemmatimonadota bacterium]